MASSQDWKDDSRRRKMSLKPEERVQGKRLLPRPFRGIRLPLRNGQNVVYKTMKYYPAIKKGRGGPDIYNNMDEP